MIILKNIKKVKKIKYIKNLNNYILTPIHLNKLDIDYNLLKIYIKNYIEPRIEYYNETNTKNLELESGFSEWWIKKTSNGTKIGNGNCPMDVITFNNNAIDTMCLCMNSNISNEKSIMQNFGSTGNNLDSFFNAKNDTKIIRMFIQDYVDKIKNFSINYKIPLTKLYYCIFISTKTNIYLSCFKINIGNIVYIKSDGFTKSMKSINIKNFIDDKYGNVKLYKSKKRLELRIKKNVINSFNTIKIL
jgi:hypothetical protein